ncbi:MAG: GtrA family protein [Acetobacteraceae bacterium]|nr:GtrA family protein [Acetobacteraceae bacterium]
MNAQRLILDRAPLVGRFFAGGRAREIVSFLLVGGTSALLYTGLNVLFTKAGVRPSLSIVITLVLLMPPTYYAQHRLTFQSVRNHRSAFPRYVGAQLFGNVIAMIAAEVFAAPIRAYPLVSFVIIAAMVAAINYGILKFWAFRHAPEAV